MTVFCKVDEPLVEIIQEEAAGRIVVDCGAGEGVLHEMMPVGSIVSLDIFDHGNPHVVLMDCRDFPFRDTHLPLFVRPCHDSFVEDTLMTCYPLVDSALYVGLLKNVDSDLGVFSKLAIPIHAEWVGEEGERIWRIPFAKRFVSADGSVNNGNQR